MISQKIIERDVADSTSQQGANWRPTSRPIDLAHLSRQTMGDRSLEQEILRMFVKQVLAAKTGLAVSRSEDRSRLAHTLKGSARNVGAFRLAECLGTLESAPNSMAELRRLSKLIDEVANFVAAIGR